MLALEPEPEYVVAAEIAVAAACSLELAVVGWPHVAVEPVAEDAAYFVNIVDDFEYVAVAEAGKSPDFAKLPAEMDLVGEVYLEPTVVVAPLVAAAVAMVVAVVVVYSCLQRLASDAFGNWPWQPSSECPRKALGIPNKLAKGIEIRGLQTPHRHESQRPRRLVATGLVDESVDRAKKKCHYARHFSLILLVRIVTHGHTTSSLLNNSIQFYQIDLLSIDPRSSTNRCSPFPHSIKKGFPKCARPCNI